MGLLDIFVGKKPKQPERQGRSAQEEQLLGTAERLREGAGQYLGLQNERIYESTRTAGAQQAAAGRATVDVTQGMGPQGALAPGDSADGQGLSPFLKRARALSRVASAGDGAIRMQSLRDRAKLATFGRGIRSGAFGAMAGGAGLQSTQDRASYAYSMAPDYNAPYRANFAGTVIGAGIGAYQNHGPSLVQRSQEIANYSGRSVDSVLGGGFGVPVIEPVRFPYGMSAR